jgi:hypothetical protein
VPRQAIQQFTTSQINPDFEIIINPKYDHFIKKYTRYLPELAESNASAIVCTGSGSGLASTKNTAKATTTRKMIKRIFQFIPQKIFNIKLQLTD